MKKIEAFDSFKRVNENKLTNEELMDFVHKLGYNSLDDIKKEKSKLAKLEALFNELNMDNGQPAKKVEEDDITSGAGSDTSDDVTSSDGSDTGDDVTSSDGSDTGDDVTSSDGSDTGSDTDFEGLPGTTEAKPKSMHIKSFAEFCGEIEEEKESKTNSDIMNEATKITSDEQFKEYAMNILKKAHPDDFDEKIANETIEGILKDHNGDYGAAIGALNHGLSESKVNESAISSDEEFEKYAMDRMKKKHPNDFDENIAKKVIDDLKKKYEGNYGAMVGALR